VTNDFVGGRRLTVHKT